MFQQPMLPLYTVYEATRMERQVPTTCSRTNLKTNDMCPLHPATEGFPYCVYCSTCPLMLPTIYWTPQPDNCHTTDYPHAPSTRLAHTHVVKQSAVIMALATTLSAADSPMQPGSEHFSSQEAALCTGKAHWTDQRHALYQQSHLAQGFVCLPVMNIDFPSFSVPNSQLDLARASNDTDTIQ